MLLIIYLDVGSDGIILGYSSSPFSEDCVEIEVDSEHPVLVEFGRYRYIEGELIRLSQEEIDELINMPTPKTELEVLRDTVEQQELVIEELMFTLIPELMALKGGGEI